MGAHGLGLQLAISSVLLIVTLGVWGALADRHERGRLLAGGTASQLGEIREVLVSRPTLETLFLKLTGRELRE